jgi:hypothetical protein
MGLRSQTLQASNLRTPAGQERAGSVEETSAVCGPAAALSAAGNSIVERFGEIASALVTAGLSPPQPARSGDGPRVRAAVVEEMEQRCRSSEHAAQSCASSMGANSDGAHMGEHEDVGEFVPDEMEDEPPDQGRGGEYDGEANGDSGVPSNAAIMDMMNKMADVVAKLTRDMDGLKASGPSPYHPYSARPPSPGTPYSPAVTMADVMSVIKSSAADIYGRWMANEADSLEFMAHSKAPALAEHNTKVRVAEVIDATPTSKAETKSFMLSVGSALPFAQFLDTITHHEYVDRRRELVLAMAVTANLQKDRADGIKAADRIASKALKSIDLTKDAEGRQMLAKIQRSVVDYGRNGQSPSLTMILDEMDLEFAKVTAMERDHEIKNQLDAISVVKHAPSVMVSLAQSLYMQQYQSIADTAVRQRVVLRDVQSLVSEKIRTGASQYEWMDPFRQKLLDTGFQRASMSEWVAQFKVYESTAEFRRGQQDAARATPGDSKRAMMNKGKGINAVHDEDGGDDAGSIAAIGELRTTIGELQAKIAALSGTQQGPGSPSWRTIEWVATFGVVGYPAPGDSQRKPLKVGLIWRKAGVTIPAGCPKEPMALVGFHCPCNHFRKIPEDMWFYHPDSRQFKDGANAKPPPGAKNFGWMHALSKCMHAYAEAHKLARADPTLKYLLDPLPMGCVDCIGASQ